MQSRDGACAPARRDKRDEGQPTAVKQKRNKFRA
jgi:hypothetical protein